jgi:phenylpropionate dioxygenase-like ring-hydroxylating dioxygenase large terminal subunit
MTELPYPILPIPNDWDRRGLPAWTYHSPALFALEREKLFMTHWQVVGHDCDVPNPGDWVTYDLLGERAVVMRGQDGVVRAFHNLCRHRGARVVDGAQGSCKGAVVCPFHGWVYNLDGTLRGASQPKAFGTLNREEFGLKPIEMQSFHGFIFLRFGPGPQPDVATLLAPFDADFAACDLKSLLPVAVPDWSTDLPVNWKSVRDVDDEGYHVALAHPALQDLYGRTYRDHHLENGLSMSIGWFGDVPAKGWSVRQYVKASPPRPDLPQHLQKAWAYYGLFPNQVFTVTREVTDRATGAVTVPADYTELGWLMWTVTALALIAREASFAHWARAKSFHGFGPLGPVVATGLDPHALVVRTRVNGRERQNYPVADMVFDPVSLVERLSRDMTLAPGDVIACGTSLGALPVKAGTLVEVEIDGIGVLANRFV